MGLPDQWDSCSRTILLEDNPSAFACWGDIIAVGLRSNVKLLNAMTGITTSVLSGHTAMICSLAFSPDGTLLVSESDDNSIKVWDIQTGGVVRTFGEVVRAPTVDGPFLLLPSSLPLSFSPDGNTIAVGALAGVILLWNVQTWKCHSIKTYHGNQLAVVSFSPINPRRLISSSFNGHIQEWDVYGHRIRNVPSEAGRVEDRPLRFETPNPG